jgi:hypothetical protein
MRTHGGSGRANRDGTEARHVDLGQILLDRSYVSSTTPSVAAVSRGYGKPPVAGQIDGPDRRATLISHFHLATDADSAQPT